MMHIFTEILSALFPESSATRAVRKERPEQFLRFFAPTCLHHTITLLPYAAPTVRAAITANKFHHDRHAAILLGSVLEHWLGTLPPRPTVLIPLPLGAARLRDRGHNQVESIVAQLTLHSTITIRTDLLIRKHETSAQSQLTRDARFVNVANAFAWHPAADSTSLLEKRIVLVDDVITTGATMMAAKAALMTRMPRQTEVWCVGIAH